MKPKSNLKYLFLTFLIIVVDLLSKSVAGLSLRVLCNRAMAFGLNPLNWEGLESNILAIIVSILVIIYIGYLFLTERRPLQLFSYALILGGGGANLIDRLLFGCVRDFIHVPFYPSFNLADCAITLGIILIVFSYLRHGRMRH